MALNQYSLRGAGWSKEVENFRNKLSRFVGMDSRDTTKLETLYGRLLAATSDLERGEHLIAIRTLLEPRGMFAKFLKALPLFTVRTAYRNMGGYSHACQRLTPAIVEEAKLMDMPLYGPPEAPYGRFTEAIKNLPPPFGSSRKLAREWLEAIQKASPGRLPSRTTDPDRVLQECFRVFANRTGWIDLTPREQKIFLKKFVGLMMAHWGIERTSFSPAAMVPDNLMARNQAQQARRARVAAG